jgi:YD repeat-containing protein
MKSSVASPLAAGCSVLRLGWPTIRGAGDSLSARPHSLDSAPGLSPTRLRLTGLRVPFSRLPSLSLLVVVLAVLTIAVGNATAQGTAPSLDGTPTTQSCAACSSLTVTLPSMSNSSGDFIVAEVVTLGSAYTATPPPGYLLIGPTPTPGVSSYKLLIYGYFYGSGDPTTVTFSLPSNATGISVIAAAYKGVDSFTPVDGGTGGPGQASSTAATTLVAPSIAVSQSNDTLLTFYVANGAVNFSNPTPANSTSPCDFTQGACIEAPTTQNGTHFSATFADNSLASTQGIQSTGNQSITISASTRDWLAMQLALEAAPPASPPISLDQPPATTTYQSTSIDTVTLNFPSGVASGDICISEFTPNNTSATVSAAPSGWTLIRTDNAGGSGAEAALYWYKSLGGGSDPSIFTWTLSVENGLYVGWIQCFSGVNTSAPIDPNNPTGVGAGNGSATSLTVPAFGSSLAQNGEELILNCAVRKGSDLTWSGETAPYSQFTQLGNTGGQGLAMGIYANDITFYSSVGSEGAPGAQTCTQSTGISYPMAGEQIALQPGPIPTATATATATVTVTATPTATATATASATATNTTTATVTATTTATSTETDTQTPTDTPTDTPIATQTATATSVPTATSTASSGGSSGQSGTISYVYDTVGRLIAVYDPSGNAAVYSYDLVGNLLSITNYSANQLAAFYLNPNNSQSGSTVTIDGTDFCSSPTVSFNGIDATVVSATSTKIVVTVPSGNTSGQVVVTCGSTSIDVGGYTAPGNLTPSITSFSPSSGGPGETVTITGSGFQPNSITVAFNNTPALVISATASTVTAIVPADATSGPIAVSDSYGQAVTNGNFGVLPPGTVYVANLVPGGPPGAVSLDAGSQQALFTFNGTAGEQVLISFDDPQLDCASSATVNSPNGSTLGSFDNLCNGVGFLVEVLPATGTYSLFVNDGYDPGSLGVSLANIAQLPTSSVGGAAVNVNVPVGQTSAVAFQANAGNQVSLAAAFPGNSIETPSILVVAPDGSIVSGAVPNPTFFVPFDYNIGYQTAPGEYLDSVTLAETGTYIIVGESSNEDIVNNIADQFTVQLHSAPLIAENIAIGGPAVTLTPVPGQTAQLTFSGNIGQAISLGYVTQDYFPVLSGTNPDGSSFSVGGVSVGNEDYISGGWEDCSGSTGFYCTGGTTWYYSAPVVLPQNGIYQINIDLLGSPYSAVVNLYDATSENGTISIGGPAVTVNTEPGQSDNLSFAGTAGQQIGLELSNSTYNYGLSSPAMEALVSVENPDGSTLNLGDNIISGSEEINDGSDSSYFFYTLQQTGTYVAQISAANHEPGTVNAQIYDLTPVNGGSISVDGPSVPMDTEPSQPLELSFSGTAGQQLGLSASDSSYPYVFASVYDPNGNSVASSVLNDGGQISALGIPPLSLPGTYTIDLAGGGNLGDPDRATLQLYSRGQENFITSVGGAPVDVTLNPFQNANISFNANAGQWIAVATSNAMLDGIGCVSIELLNPDGSWANSLFACDQDAATAATQLAQSGTYSVFVDGGFTYGTIDIQVADATPVSGTMPIDGAPVDPSMSTPWQNFNYTFGGNAGQEVGLSVTNFSSYDLGECSPEITLYDPNGNYIDSIYLFPSEFPDGSATLGNGNDVLPSDGTYSIFLDNAGCTSGSMQIDLYTSNTQTGTITFNGPTVSAASTVPGQPTQLTISGGTGQSVYLNTSSSTYQDCVSVELIDQTQADLGNYSYVDSLYQCGAGSSGTMGPDTLSSDSYALVVTPYGQAGSIDLSLSSQ